MLQAYLNRAKCILASSRYKTKEQLETALKDLCFFIENTPEGSEESNKHLAEAYNLRGEIYAGNHE